VATGVIETAGAGATERWAAAIARPIPATSQDDRAQPYGRSPSKGCGDRVRTLGTHQGIFRLTRGLLVYSLTPLIMALRQQPRRVGLAHVGPSARTVHAGFLEAD